MIRPPALLCVLLMGCAETLIIPLYDQEPLLESHPTLAAQVVEAADYYTVQAGTPIVEWVRDDDHIIAVGDNLRVVVEGHPDLSVDRAVLPDGRISVPECADLRALSLTLGQLASDIQTALAKRVKETKVCIEISRPREKFTIDVIGMVNSPGPQTYRIPPWLVTVVQAAGGCSRLANFAQILIVRPSEKRVIVCDLMAFTQKGKTVQNATVMPEDIVVVTELYPPDKIPAAREWDPIARFLEEKLTRAELLLAIRNLPRPSWKVRS